MTYITGADGSGDASAPPEDASSQQGESVAQDAPPEMEGTGCVFCDRVRLPEQYDRASLILLRAEYNFVILNLYPYNSAHLMIVPYHHTADFVGLPLETLVEMTSLAQRMVGLITEEYHPQGFNLGMNLGRPAGAGVADHLHLHIVPRWSGDTNFMPIIGSTKVMPELLETTYDRLKRRM